MNIVRILALLCVVAGACREAPSTKQPNPEVAVNQEPTAQDLLRNGWALLGQLGHDPACYDFQIVDRHTKLAETRDSNRPAFQVAIEFIPSKCSSEYCLEFEGMASRGMSWCLERDKPTAEQQHVIDVSYSRYRRDYPGAPALHSLVTFVDETPDAVHVTWEDRQFWNDLKSGRVEPYPSDWPGYALSKAEVGLKRAPASSRNSTGTAQQ